VTSAIIFIVVMTISSYLYEWAKAEPAKLKVAFTTLVDLLKSITGYTNG
jgi:hypothetical protein